MRRDEKDNEGGEDMPIQGCNDAIIAIKGIGQVLYSEDESSSGSREYATHANQNKEYQCVSSFLLENHLTIFENFTLTPRV